MSITSTEEKFNFFNIVPCGDYLIHFKNKRMISRNGTGEEPSNLYTLDKDPTSKKVLKETIEVINEIHEMKITKEGIFFNNLSFKNENNQNIWKEKVDEKIDFLNPQMPQFIKIEGKNIVHISRIYLTSSFIIKWYSKFGTIEMIPFKIIDKEYNVQFHFK